MSFDRFKNVFLKSKLETVQRKRTAKQESSSSYSATTDSFSGWDSSSSSHSSYSHSSSGGDCGSSSDSSGGCD